MSDLWAALRSTTRARVGLGRTGDALPISDILDFQLAHARARDAVHTPLDTGAIAAAVGSLRSRGGSVHSGLSANAVAAVGGPDTPGHDGETLAGHDRVELSASIIVRSLASDRDTYLRRPDLGRRLDPACGLPSGPFDAAFVIGDGLSPVGVQRHAVPLLQACLDRLQGWSIAPIVIATQARVALGDEIGAALQAQLCAVLIGERPGLSVADSLGVYLTYQPQAGRLDSERNCISNIHPDGLSYDAAADMLVWLMTEARHRKLTGVALKAERSFPEQSPAPHRLG